MYEVVFIAISVVLAAYLLKKDGRKNTPPGPEQSFLLGNVKDVDINKLPQCLQKLARQHGPVVSLRLVSKRIVVFNSATVIRKAFQSEEFKDLFNDKPQGFYGTYLLYGHQDVLFGPYKEVTFKAKKLMYTGVEPFHGEEYIAAEVEDFITKLTATAGRDVDPRSIVESIMTELHTKILKGTPLPDDSDIILDFARSSNALLQPSNEMTLKLFPFLRHLNGDLGQTYRTALDCRDKLLARFFDEQLKTYSPEVTRGLVDVCFHIRNKEKDPEGRTWLTDDILKAIIIDIIGAGLIATTNSILALFSCLANNPECQRKMQAEITEVIRNGRKPCGRDIIKLHYCHAVLLESFRYNSIVPIVSHLCSERDVEFEGYCIPKGSVLFGCFLSAHSDEAVWKDPNNFRPERFIDDQGKLLPVDHELRKSLFPYGTGSRVCIGKSLTHIRLLIYITAILQHFDIAPPKESELLLNDPRLFKPGPVLQVPDFTCRFLSRIESIGQV